MNLRHRVLALERQAEYLRDIKYLEHRIYSLEGKFTALLTLLNIVVKDADKVAIYKGTPKGGETIE